MKKHNAVDVPMVSTSIGNEFTAMSAKLGFSPRERAELERLYGRFVNQDIGYERKSGETRCENCSGS